VWSRRGCGPAINQIQTYHLQHNVIVREADQYGKRITPARYFRVIIEILRDALSFLLIMPAYSEEDLTNALATYRNHEFTSIRKCAYAFNIPYSTLASRLSTRTSRSQSHESQQILSTAEEQTLLKAITRLSKSGCPITLLLTRDLAEEIRLSRFRLSSTPTSYPPISKRWIDRFRKRNPELKTVYSRALDASRFEGVNYPVVNAYFDALTDLFLENSYPSDAIFNVDETGFALGTTLP